MNYQERYIPQDDSDHNNVAVITGISGSGKDFLIHQAQQQGILSPEITVVGYGQEIFNYLREKYPSEITTRDDLKRLSPSQLLPAIDQVAEDIVEHQPIVVNAHTVVQQETGILISPTVDKKLQAASYLYIWTDPDQVMQWRDQDMSRKRKKESIEDISFFQDLSLEFVQVIAKKMGASFNTVWNRADNIGENLAKLGDVTRSLLK